MKLIFEPINSDKIKYINKDYNFEDYQEIYNYRNEELEENDEVTNNNYNNKNIITFPLAYVFLIYAKEIDFLKDILLSSIKFSKDYQKVVFEENEIYANLRREKDRKKIKIQKKESNRICQRKSSVRIKGNILRKKASKVLNKITINNLKEEQEKNVNFSLEDSNKEIYNEDINNLYKTNKKIITIHANPDLRKKENNKNELFKDKKEIKYTEYNFIWETPKKTYGVRMIMPIVIFWSEHIKKNIIIYCDKDLFLFLFQNNFINWDYYILNYLFSIKVFRQIILYNLSFYRKNNVNNIKLSSYTERENKNKYLYSINKAINYSLFSYINEKTILLNDQLNENNESLEFFYTDNYSINSIIFFHSYHIFIEYNKLNTKNCWEFALNFKQMKFLSNINKYENLETFLPKIIKTNFEDGNLSMDFSVFEFFNTKILENNRVKENHKNNILSNTDINKKINNDMILVIKMPFIKSEQFVKSRFLSNNINTIFLTSYFLNALSNSPIISWSKKILQILNFKDFSQSKSSLNLVKDENCYSFNDVSKNDNYDNNDYINEYYNYKKISKSLHYKKKKVSL